MEKDTIRMGLAHDIPLDGHDRCACLYGDRAPISPLPRMENPDEGGCGCEEEKSTLGCRGHEGCGEGSWGLSEYPLAMVYAPCQHFRALYDPYTALHRGTLFTELDLPLGKTEGCAFTTGEACCRSNPRK